MRIVSPSARLVVPVILKVSPTYLSPMVSIRIQGSSIMKESLV